MKHTTKEKIIRGLNTILLCIFLYCTLNHQKITSFTTLHHPKFINYSNLNPLQHLASGVHSFVLYITSFVTFKSIQQQTESTQLQIQSLQVRSNAIIQSIDEMQETLVSALLPKTHKIQIVELKHKVFNNNTHQIYFQTPEEISINSLVMAKSCIIGRVINNNKNTYQVLSITDSNFRLPAVTKTSQVFGIFYGGASPKFIPFASSNSNKISTNEEILTISSTKNLPENIPIGQIQNSDLAIKIPCKSYYHYAFIL